jgi:hypothetical protein
MPTPPTDRPQGVFRRQQRQAHTRVPFDGAVSLSCLGHETRGWAVNISAGGICVEADDQFPVGARVEVDTLLTLEDSVHQLKAEGQVIHTFGHGMGIQFVDLSPLSAVFIGRLVHHFLYSHRR